MWTADDLLASVRLRGTIPSTGVGADANLLILANEELMLHMIALVESTNEDYYSFYSDVALVGGVKNYALPTRSVGMALIDLQRVDLNGNVIGNIAKTSLDQLDFKNNGFYLRLNDVNLVRDPGTTTDKLRMVFPIRPNQLVLKASAFQVTASNWPTITVTGTPPTGSTVYDIINGTPGFEHRDIDRTATASGNTMTFTGTAPSRAVAVGDWVSLAQTSPMVQLPAELHVVLAQRTYMRVLEAQGDTESLALAKTSLEGMINSALRLLHPRDKGQLQKITARNNPIRAFRGGRRRRMLPSS